MSKKTGLLAGFSLMQRNSFYQEWLGVQSIANLAVTSSHYYETMAGDQKYFWLGKKFHTVITDNLNFLQSASFKTALVEIISFSQREDEDWKLGKALDPSKQRIRLKSIIDMLPATLQK